MPKPVQGERRRAGQQRRKEGEEPPPVDGPAFSRRLTFASILPVLGLALSVAIHAWTEAKLALPETEMTAQKRHRRVTRLLTVLPIIRFGIVGLIRVAYVLVAWSMVGIDVGPLTADAGIVGSV